MAKQTKTKTTATARTTAKAKSSTATKAKRTARKSKKTVVAPSYDAIAERAWCIWTDNGCQPGQEEHNWFEAVSQLEAEKVTC